MTILINLYNQLGAGPKNISLNLISEAVQKKNQTKMIILVPNVEEYAQLVPTDSVQILKLPKYNHFLMKMVYRFFLDLIYIPLLVSRYQASNLLAFGNYLLSPVFAKKTVLLHHPYLFDDDLLKTLATAPRLIEQFKRGVFWLTLHNVHTVVVQSSYVMQMFKQKWPNFKGNISLIPNPISNSFKQQTTAQTESLITNRLKTIEENLQILFVSRFYPHKNHSFLIALSQALSVAQMPHTIFVTINPNLVGAAGFLGNVQSKKLPIINLGEIPQPELNDYYEKGHLFVFPSKSETFGNPLIEAMSYGLPIIVPALQYAKAVVGETGIYYRENDAKDCATKILSLIKNRPKYIAKSLSTNDRFNLYPNVETWAKLYLSLLES
jgi:glycosyltransferase involved in cell wall biosynthesis